MFGYRIFSIKNVCITNSRIIVVVAVVVQQEFVVIYGSQLYEVLGFLPDKRNADKFVRFTSASVCLVLAFLW